jgi:outer membrane protein W
MSNQYLIKLVFPVVLFFCQLGFGQKECVKNFKKAKKFYEEGNIEQVESLVSGCLENGFTKEEKMEAQKLLVLAALFDDDLESADNHMIEFLKLDPEYQIVKGKDQREFIRLYDKFKTIPFISLGLTVGTNLSLVEEFTTVGVQPTGNSESSYKSVMGLTFGLKLNKQFTKHFSFELALEFNQNSFEYSGKYYDSQLLLISQEQQNWLGIPAVVSYSFLSGKVQPYLGVGASLGYLFSAKSDQTLTYTDAAERKLPSTTSSTELRNNHREKLNYWGIVALGARVKVPRAFVSVDVSYRRNLKQQTNSKNRYLDSDTYFNTLYLDDDFYMDNVYCSVSYVYSFYNPKKKRAYAKESKSKKVDNDK